MDNEEIERKVAEFRGQIEGEDLNIYVKELRKSLPWKARASYIFGNVIAGIITLIVGFVFFLLLVVIVKGLVLLTKAIF